MASKIPDGPGTSKETNKILSDEQAKLLVKVVNSSAEEAIPVSGPLLDYIKTILPQEGFSVSNNPQAEDIIAFANAGNLSAVIPAGFLLLHNDLLNLSDEEIAPKSGTAFNSNTTGSLLASGLLAAAGLLGAGLISDSLSGLMEDLLAETDASELANDEDIKSAVKRGLKGYITVFFLAQDAYLIENVLTHLITDVAAVGGMLGKGEGAGSVFNKIAEGALIIERTTEVVQDVFSLFGGEESLPKQQAALALKVADAVLTAMIGEDSEGGSLNELANDEGIKESVKASLASYIKVFFYAQAAELAVDKVEDVAATIGAAVVAQGWSFVVDAAVGVIKEIGDLFTNNEFSLEGKMKKSAYEVLENVLDTLDTEELKKDSNISKALIEGLSTYIKAFFMAQSYELSPLNNPDTGPGWIYSLIQGVAETPTLFVEGVRHFVEALLPFLKDNTLPNKAKSLLTSAITEVDYSEMDDSEKKMIRSAVMEGLSSYIGAFFDIQAEQLGVRGWLAEGVEGLKDFIQSIFPIFFAEERLGDTIASKLVSILQVELDKIDPATDDSGRWEGIIEEGIHSYINALFASAGEDIEGKLSATKSIRQNLEAAILNNLVIEEADIPSTDALRNTKQELILSAVNTILGAQIDAITLPAEESSFDNPIFTVEATTVVGNVEETTTEMSSTLSEIRDLLKSLSEVIEVIRDKDTTPVIIDNTTVQQGDSLEVNTPGSTRTGS